VVVELAWAIVASSPRSGRSWCALLVAGALALASGCFRAGYDELATTCTSADDCAGATCVDGVCAGIPPGTPDADPTAPDADPTAPDADPGAPDAGSPDASIGPPPPTPCGSMQLLRDNFDDGVPGPQWIPSAPSGVTVSEANRYLAIRLAAGSAEIEGVYRSRNAYDLTSSEVSVEVLGVAGQITALEVRDFAERGAAIAVEGGNLLALTLDADSESTRASVRYSATTHRYWRLREASGTLFWETSPDRAVWSTLHAQALPMPGTYAFAYLLAWGQLATVSEARFDDLNTPAATVPGFCKAGSVQDGFDDGTLADTWNAWVGSGSCTHRETGGVAQLSFTGSGDEYCGIETRQLVDGTDTTVSVEVIAPPQDATFYTWIELVSPDHAHKVEFQIGDGLLYMLMTLRGSQVFASTRTFSPTNHRFLRLRESAGGTHWDVSANGTTWNEIVGTTTQVDLRAVILDLAGGHRSPGPGGPRTLRYDKLNP
jgi:hypothetical protein